MSVLIGFDESLESNLRICDSTAGDTPAPGDAGGLWYCGSPSQSCNDSGTITFGIEPGFFADFRNFSSFSTAATTSTKSTAKTSSLSVTTDVSVTTDTAANATATPRTPEPSCPTQTGTKHTFSGGDIAAIVLGVVCAVLIALDIHMFFFQRRSGGSPEAVQRPMHAEQNRKEGVELDGNPRTGSPSRELPGERLSRVELY